MAAMRSLGLMNSMSSMSSMRVALRCGPQVSLQQPLSMQQRRGFRRHTNEAESFSTGRSVVVKNTTPAAAYMRLRQILDADNFRALVKSQERFESNHDKRRRIRKQRDWAVYIAEVRRQSRKAVELRNRTEIEFKNYEHI